MMTKHGHILSPLNRILALMPAPEFEQLQECMLRVPLVRDQVLADYGQSDDYAFFVEHGVVSLMSEPLDDEDGIQVAMVGREGVVGSHWLIDARYSARVRVVVHIAGSAFRVSGNDLRQAIARCPVLHDACNGFVRSLMTQIMHTSAFNARRSLAERCARWLVMTQDRVEGSEIRITHEALSNMLGMRRSGVTVAAAALQEAGLIRTGRGRFMIVNSDGLRGLAHGGARLPVAAASSAKAGVPALLATP